MGRSLGPSSHDQHGRVRAGISELWITQERPRRSVTILHVTRRPGDLPPELSKASFTVAQGTQAGLTRKRMRAADLQRPFYGVRQAGAVRRPEGETPEEFFRTATAELLDRCAAAELVVPDGAFFSHITAAWLWPLPMPGRLIDGPLHVGVRPPEHAPRRAGVIGHHISDPAAYPVARKGHSLIDPATLFCQLSSVLRLEDLVATGDALVLKPRFPDISDERPWLTLSELGERVERFRGRGKTRAAQALELIRPGAESRPESLVRLAMLAAGLPEPELNVDIYDDAGQFVGRADMLLRRYRLIVEYDGDQHRVDTDQFDRDVGRLDDFAACGWRVVRVTKRAFFGDRAGCLTRIEQALIAGGWRR